MTQLEIYKSFQFMTELLIAEGIFFSRLKRRKHFWARLAGTVVVLYGISYLFPVAAYNAFYISFMFFALFAITVGASMFLFDEKFTAILFCAIAGYTTQHLSYEMYNLILNSIGGDPATPLGFYGATEFVIFGHPLFAIFYFCTYILVYFAAWYILARRLRMGEDMRMKRSIFIFVILLLVVDIILNAVIVYNIAEDSDKLYLVIVGIYNILCCLLCLFMQFEVSLRRRLEGTIDTLRALHEKEREQYEDSKNNIELINIKCHDLRHQIRRIVGDDADTETAKELEQIISIYDSSVKTGNETLDVVLTEKSLMCSRHEIRLSIIADGAPLGFMSEGDIYSLFGNIMDNAIEAVLGFPPEKRLISLRIKTVGSLISINEHNYIGSPLVFENDLPVTTKADKRYHGFGMKSIRYICEKYGGELNVDAQNNAFSLNILFPTS